MFRLSAKHLVASPFLAAVFCIYVCVALKGANAQTCETPAPNEYRLTPNHTVYYSLDPSLNNIPQGTGAGAGTAPVTQITNAIATWNANNGIGITFSPASAGHAATYSISAQMTKVDYTGNTGTTYAQPGVIPVGANSNTYLYPNQRFHDGSPTFSSSAIGYATAYQEIMLHEIGHLLGLNDLNNDKTSGTALSVME